MSRPPDLPPAERFPHGTRARYTCGCRCDGCRAANVRYYHERQARAKAAAAQLASPPGPPLVRIKGRTVVMYRRACPGLEGVPCVGRAGAGSYLRKDSGGVCAACRELLVWNGNVDAKPVRSHLLSLSRRGVGYKSVAQSCDVPTVTLAAVLSGEKRWLRRRTAERVLAVTELAVADHGLVDAKPSWKLIKTLLQRGWSKTEISKRLGSNARRPSLQLHRRRILARTALKVRRLYDEAMRGEARLPPLPIRRRPAWARARVPIASTAF